MCVLHIFFMSQEYVMNDTVLILECTTSFLFHGILPTPKKWMLSNTKPQQWLRIGFHTKSYVRMHVCKTVWKTLEQFTTLCDRNGETGNKNHCYVAGYFSVVPKQPNDNHSPLVIQQGWRNLFRSPYLSLIKLQGRRPVNACGPGQVGPRGPDPVQGL